MSTSSRLCKLCKLVEVVTENLDSVDVVGAVQLLVLRVSSIVTAADGEENDVLASCLLERERHGNGAAL